MMPHGPKAQGRYLMNAHSGFEQLAGITQLGEGEGVVRPSLTTKVEATINRHPYIIKR